MWPRDEVKWDSTRTSPVQHDLERGKRDNYTTDEVTLVCPGGVPAHATPL